MGGFAEIFVSQLKSGLLLISVLIVRVPVPLLQNKKVLAFITLQIERLKFSVSILDVCYGILQVEKKISLASAHVLKRLLSAGPLEILIISDSDLIGRFLSKYRSF